METRVLVSTRHVSKGFMARKEKPIAKFGIGSGFEAERGNCGLTMVQRDNIWHPYYEVKMEEADLAAQYRQSQDAKKQGKLKREPSLKTSKISKTKSKILKRMKLSRKKPLRMEEFLELKFKERELST